MHWVTNTTLAVWGIGDDDYFMIPAVQFFDAETGKRIRWFAGPKGERWFFDTYLMTASKDEFEVWDLETGERLLHIDNFNPLVYHPKTQQFLTVLPDGDFQLSRIMEQDQ